MTRRKRKMSAGEQGRRETRAKRPAPVAKPGRVYFTRPRPRAEERLQGPPDDPKPGTGSQTSAAETQRCEQEREIRDSCRALFEHSIDSILLTTPDGRILAANPAACRLFGRTEEQLRRGGRGGVVDPADHRMAAAVEERARTGRFRGELTFYRSDGSRFTGELSSAVFKDEHGQDRASIFIRDITERKQAEEALRASEANYREIFNATQEAIFIHEAGTGRIIDVNETMLQMYGYESKAEVTARHMAEMSANEAPYTQEIAQHRIRRAMEEGPQVFEWLTRRKNGERFWVEVSLKSSPIGGEGCVLAVVRDIQERKRLEEEREINVRLLSLLNAPSDLHELMRQVTQLLHKWFECEAVGIRLAQGGDFPYFETRGFPAEFVRAESRLCLCDAAGQPVRDPEGNPVLECMCGNVLCGRFDPAKPFFTARGSFWSNCTTDLLASTTDADRQVRTCNRCNGEGYESVALVALRMGQTTYGLLQVNDRRKDRFTPQRIALLERLGDNLAVAMAHRQGQETLGQKEEYFRALTERASDVITVLNANGTIRYQSPSSEGVLGYGPHELVGRTVFDLIHPDDLARAQQALAQSAATPGSSVRIELQLRHKDSSWRVLEATSRNLLDHPNVRGIVVNSRDNTQRRRLEEALRESSQFNHEIVASAQEGIIVYDADLRCKVWNPCMERLTGLSASAVLGKFAVEVFPFLRETETAAGWVAALAGGEATASEVAYRVPETDRWGWTRHTNSPLRDSQGKVIGVIALVRDITERKRDELRITAFAHLGQRLNAAKTFRQAAEILLEVADELLGWDCCLFHLYSADENRLSCELCMDLINGQRTECTPPDFPRSPTALARRAIEQGGQLILRDQADSTQAEGVPFGDTSRRSASIMYVPIRRGTEIVGVLSIQSYTPRAYDADSLETLQALADYGGGALERLRTQEALSKSEATFRSVWERSIDGMRLTDSEGRIIAVNDAFCQLVKLPREKLEGEVLSVAYKGHGANDGIELYQKRFATGDIVPHLLARAQLWNGDEPDLEISNSFVELGQRGRMLLSIFRDVSERIRAQSRVAAFSNLGQRLSAARSPAEAARAIYATADEFWKWDSGVLDLQVPESEQIETALAYDLVDGQRREVLLPNPVGPPSAMNRRVMARGAELILRQPDEAKTTDTIRFGDAARLSASLMWAPVHVESRAVGVLAIQSYTPNAYTQEDLRTLQALADHCGGALDRLRMEGLLGASEARYRRLFEAAKDGVLILDAETGMVVDVNPFLVQLLGSSREAFLTKRIWELGFFKEIVANQASFEELRREEYIRYDDKPLETADGRRKDVEFVSNGYQVDHHAVIQCNIRDISERKRIEWIGQIYRDQLRALSARVETMREEERTRISREIHDELGQMLTGIKMDLRWMEHRLDEFGDDRRVNPILDKLVATAELTDATVKTVQRIAAELRPGLLDKLGLPMALQYEAARFEERTGIACRLVLPSDVLTLQPEVTTAFFRIFQEALTNVARHAQAKAVEAELQPEADGCRLEIRDNGKGMGGLGLENSKSLGLLGMRERAALLSGSVSFAPRPGGGTVVTVRIPSSPTNA